MKKNIAFKLALVMLCCGCSADDYTTSPDDSGQISFAVTTGDAATRGSVIDDTTMPITEQFRVFAWQTVSGTTTAMMTSGDGGDAESNVVSYTAGSWSPKKLYRWPSEDDATVSFYAVYPKDYTVVKDGSNYSLGFTIPQAVGSQHDLMVAKSQDVSYDSTTDGAASLAFNHLLSQVSFQAQLAQAFTGWQVSVTGISICNVNSRGTYLYNDGSITPITPAVVQNHPLVMAASPVVVNSTGSPVALTSTSDVALLMPQTLTAWDRVNETSGTTTPITDGCYLAVDCTITNASSTQVFSGTTYVPLAAVWLSGYRYNYLLQFGTGYTGAGDSHIADIMLSCSINNWNDPYSGSTPPDEFTQTQTVTGCDLTIDAIANQTYTGSAITPSLTVHKGDTPLTLNAANGYTVQYQNNTNVGTASVVVSGQGTYAGSYGVATFAIDKKPITTADIVLASQSLTYNGSAQTRNVTSVGTETNTSNFTVTDNTQTNAGDYNLTVTMAANCPNYTGTATSPWSIAKAATSMNNSDGAVSFTSSQGANTEISRTITCTNCSVSGASVASGSGFTVSYTGNTVKIKRTSTAAISGTVNVTGTPSNGNYNAPTNITISVSAAVYDPGVALSASAVGYIVTTDAKCYASISDIPSGKTKAGMVSYKRDSEGIVISLTDYGGAGTHVDWNVIVDSNDNPKSLSHTPAVSGYNWRCGSRGHYERMWEDYGCGSWSNFETMLDNAGGTRLLKPDYDHPMWIYWTVTLAFGPGLDDDCKWCWDFYDGEMSSVGQTCSPHLLRPIFTF